MVDRLSVLTPENRKFLENEGRKSPDVSRKVIILGDQSYRVNKNGELYAYNGTDEEEEDEDSSSEDNEEMKSGEEENQSKENVSVSSSPSMKSHLR